VDEWRPKSDRHVSVASCNGRQIVCAVGSELFYLEINPGSLKQIRYAWVCGCMYVSFYLSTCSWCVCVCLKPILIDCFMANDVLIECMVEDSLIA